jgi:predicted PurR-regulated permease PerM
VPERAAPARTPGEVARRTLIVSVVALAAVVLALALWKIRLIVGLFFFGVVIASAMKPGVESLHRRRVPRALGVTIHYAALGAVAGLLLWLAVPRAVTQVQNALSGLPSTKTELKKEAAQSEGLKHDLLVGVERRLNELPSGSDLFVPALELTKRAVEVIVGIFFLFASAAYWIFERERAERLILSVVPRRRRDVVRDTWHLIDLRLGAFVRGQLLLILLVGSVLSLAFWAIGLPYWLLVGAFAGIVEIVPVIGPLAAGALAVGVGLTVSWELALYAGIIVLGVRLLEDYLVMPRVLGDAVALSPLIVLAAVSAVGVLFGGFAVLLAIPLATVLGTLIDVVLLKKDPAKEDVPTVILPASDAETG